MVGPLARHAAAKSGARRAQAGDREVRAGGDEQRRLPAPVLARPAVRPGRVQELTRRQYFTLSQVWVPRRTC